MALRFRIEDGQAAIYDPTGAGDDPLYNPRDNLDDLKWHNELEHVGVVEYRDYSVNLPSSSAESPPYQNTFVLDTHDQAAEPFVYGYITVDGDARPFAMHAVVDNRNGNLAGEISGYLRHASLGIDGDDIVLNVWARSPLDSVADRTFPAVTIGVRVYITDLALTDLADPDEPTPNRNFLIDSTGAQLGPFNTDRLWLAERTGVSAQFPLINGITFDGSSPATWRYRIPASSAFAYTVTCSASTPPDVDTATAVDVTT